MRQLFAVARLIVGDDEAAADAVQDALIAAWRDLPTLRDVERFDGWLRRLLVRSSQRAAVVRRGRRVVEIRLVDDTDPSGRDDVAIVAIRDQLDRGFARLSPEHRSVVVLRHYLGLTQAETAEALDVPAGTVDSRLSRALSVLRAAIEADGRTVTTVKELVR